jgi:cytochrome c oxidase subunit I+III
LFILGFLFVFVLGGLTGVMLAAVPFDWQAHDTYFVVAHLHYVVFGGMVFPLFAAFYYWIPSLSRRALSERLGRWVFGLIFVGFNVTFFPMHFTGLLGMPRRIYTYPAGMGWDLPNLLSTVGAFLIAGGVGLFLIDLIRNFRPATVRSIGNIWDAGTLEWLPNGNYATRSIPFVTSLEPLWDQPNLAEDVVAGAYFLPGAPTGYRETLITSPIHARPLYVLQMPGPSWSTVIAAIATAAFFLLLTIKSLIPALLAGVVALIMVIRWLWATDPGPSHPPVPIGSGITLPVYMTGPMSHSWWAMIVLSLVSATMFACYVFSYFYLWTVSPGMWPAGSSALPDGADALRSALLLLGSAGLLRYADYALTSRPLSPRSLRIALLLAVALLIGAVAGDVFGHWQSGLRPTDSAYAAIVYALLANQGFFVAVVLVMACYTIARSRAGLLTHERRATLDNTRLFWLYTVLQGLLTVAILHGAPRSL